MTVARFTALTSMLDDGKGKPILDSVDMKMNGGKLVAASVRFCSIIHSV